MQIRTQMSTKYIFIKFFPKIVSTRKFIGSKLKHCECNTTSVFQYKKSIKTHPEKSLVAALWIKFQKCFQGKS